MYFVIEGSRLFISPSPSPGANNISYPAVTPPTNPSPVQAVTGAEIQPFLPALLGQVCTEWSVGNHNKTDRECELR